MKLQTCHPGDVLAVAQVADRHYCPTIARQAKELIPGQHEDV